MLIPIWQTTYYSTTASTLEYTIEDEDGVQLFSGKAYKIPGETHLKININDICAPYISNNQLPAAVFTSSGGNVEGDAIKSFNLLDGEGNLLESYTFVDDWTYETGMTSSLTETINGRYAPNMICLTTYVVSELETLEWGAGSDIDGYEEAACGNAALYYKTRKGGWASFLVEGQVKRYDDYTRDKYKKFNPNTNSFGRGETVYMNEIQPRWELNTSYLTDGQSKILAEDLISSPSVYLHLLDTDEIFPVTITNTNTEYKYFINGRKKRACYQITATAANKRIRR